MPKQPKTSTGKNNAEQLLKENAALKLEIERLKNTQSAKPFRFSMRKFLKWASISLAGAIFIVASIIFYIGMTLTDTDRFMGVAGPLVQQPAIQDAVATKTTDALFERVDVESLAKEVLPDKVDFLAPSLSTQIEQFTKKEALTIIQSDTFQESWNTSVRKAHERLIDRLEKYEGDGTIDLNEVFHTLVGRLESDKLSFLEDKNLPPRIGNIVLIQADWLPKAHTLVSNFQFVRIATITLFVLLLLFAIWISNNRRRTIIQLSAMIVVLSFILLLSLRVTRRVFLNQADPTYLQAATELWSVFTRPFAIQLITTMVIGLAVLTVAWLGSNTTSATELRSRLIALFSGKIHQTIFKKENTLTLWVGKHKGVLLTLVGVGFVLALLIIDLTLSSLLSAIIIATLIAFLILSLSSDS